MKYAKNEPSLQEQIVQVKIKRFGLNTASLRSSKLVQMFLFYIIIKRFIDLNETLQFPILCVREIKYMPFFVLEVGGTV